MTLHDPCVGWERQIVTARRTTDRPLHLSTLRWQSGALGLAPLISFLVLLFVTCVCVPGEAQDGIPHGATGTLNLDYFNPTQDPHIEWLKKDQKKAHLDPAKVNLRAGEFDLATRDLRFLLDRFINYPEALMVLSFVAKSTKNPSLAIYYYEKALKIYPQYAITHAQFGLFLVEIGNPKAGMKKLERAIEIDPNLAVAHAWIAKAHLKSGNMELARQAVARARELGYKGQLH